MHKDFAEWYRQVSLAAESDKLSKRWSGVMEWVSKNQDNDAILETVRIFQGLPEKSSREKFLDTFQKLDPAFHRRNEMEHKVLAGAALVEYMRLAEIKDADLVTVRSAIIAGIALESSSLLVSEPQLGEVREAVRAELHTLSQRLRLRWALEASKVAGQAENASKALEKVTAAETWELFKAAAPTVFQALIKATRQSGKSIAAAEHNLRCADEENNILWWLEGACSRDLDTPWGNLKEAAPLIAAWELADLTDVVLGPQDAAAFLDRVVVTSMPERSEKPLEVYVNALPSEWAKGKAATVSEKGLDLAPLALALWRRGLSDPSSWQQYFESTSGLQATKSFTPDRIARQGYIEAVLLRTLAERED